MQRNEAPRPKPPAAVFFFIHPLGSTGADTTSEYSVKTFARALAALPVPGVPVERVPLGSWDDPLESEVLAALEIAFAARDNQPLALPEHLGGGDEVLGGGWPVAFLVPRGVYPQGWDEADISYNKGFPTHLLYRWLAYVQAHPLPDGSGPAYGTRAWYAQYYRPRH